MFRNYLKVTLRHLLKRKPYALINTLGLAIGMAGCLLIAQYVIFEVSYDGFHEHADRIYRLSYSKEKGGVRSFDSALTYAGVGSLMKNAFPEVQDFARLVPSRGLISTGASVFEEQDLYFADPSYLTMFSLPLVRGDRATAQSVSVDEAKGLLSLLLCGVCIGVCYGPGAQSLAEGSFGGWFAW